MLEIDFEKSLRYKEEDGGPPFTTGARKETSSSLESSVPTVFGNTPIGIQWGPEGKKSKRTRRGSRVSYAGVVYRSSYSGEDYSCSRKSKKHNYSIDERDTGMPGGECDLGEIVRKTVKWICENT